MPGALGSSIEHVERVDALRWAAQNDAGIECRGERISYSRGLWCGQRVG